MQTVQAYQFVADMIGEVSVATIAIFFLYYLCKELQQVRMLRRQGATSNPDTKYFNLRRLIRSLCLLWALLEMPYYGAEMWNAQATEEDDDLENWSYAGHLISQSAIYGAFCGFTVLWLVILKFKPRAIQCATGVTVVFSLAYFVFTLFLSHEVISSDQPLQDQKLYQYDFIVIPVTLMSISFLFLGYGAYLQVVLHSWYKNNIGWQRHVLIKLNMIVCTITAACVLRTTMVLLLHIEIATGAWEFFTSPSDDGDTHPIIWTLSAQVIPFSTLAIVLFYMSRPSTHTETTSAGDSSSLNDKDAPFVTLPVAPDENMDYYVAQSPSYSHSYFVSNPDGGHDDSADETSVIAFKGARSIKEGKSMEVEARPHSLPSSLDRASFPGSFRSKNSAGHHVLMMAATKSGDDKSLATKSGGEGGLTEKGAPSTRSYDDKIANATEPGS